MKDLIQLMLANQVAIAANRFYKRPHPGRKRLVKFPRKLEPRPRNEQGWDAGALPCNLLTTAAYAATRSLNSVVNSSAVDGAKSSKGDQLRYTRVQTRSTCG